MATKAMFDANNSTISIARELVEGEVPITSKALVLEINNINTFGNSVESVVRTPLSTSRDAKKGTVTSLNSTVELSQDLTISAYKEMMPAALSANWIGTNNLFIRGGSIYDAIKENDHWEFKIKKPLYNLPKTAKLITSGFLDERRNGELEIEAVTNGQIVIKNAKEYGFDNKSDNSMFDTNGKITIEWEDIIPTEILKENDNNYVKIPDGIAETLEIGSKAILEGFANDNNNGEFIITDIVTANNTLKLYPELVEETETPTITTPGNTIDIYSGALTGDNAETVNVTISAAGTYKIAIGSITSTDSGTQTIKINANTTEIVNEAREFVNAGDTLNNLEFTFDKTAGQETITNITLIGSNLSANNVVITYKENDIVEPVPVDRKMYVSMECKNWTSLEGSLIPYPVILDKPNNLMLFAGYNNSSNNGIMELLSSNDQDHFLFKSNVQVVEEKVDYTSNKLPQYTLVGINNHDNIKINEDGNIILENEDIKKYNFFDLFLKGSAIWIGGITPDTQFEDIYANGIARVKSINDNIIYLDKRIFPENEDNSKYVFTPDTEEQLATKTIPIYFGQFLRTYPVGDINYERISQTIELKTTNDKGETFYEYSVGNLTNTLEIGLPSQEKSTLDVNYMSRKALDAVSTALDWEREEPKFNKVMSTPTDVLRCRVSKLDESGLATIWTDATLTINNNVGQEYAIGSLAPKSVSQGNLEITLSGNVFFDSPEVMSAITNNCTVSADVFLTNEDGGIFIDIPSATLSDGNRDFTNNEKIKQALTVTAYLEEEWNYSLSTTLFPYLPSDKENVCK